MDPNPLDPNVELQAQAAGDDDPSQSPDSGKTPPPINKSIWGKARETLGNASSQASKIATASVAAATKATGAANDATRSAIETGKQAYAGSKLESAVQRIDNELDERGVKKVAHETTQAVIGKLDEVTGKRLLELLEEKLRLQDAYNDVLATRLAEALARISKLEARLHDD